IGAVGRSVAGFAVGFGAPFACVGTAPWVWAQHAAHSGPYANLIGTLPGVLRLGPEVGIGLYLLAWVGLGTLRQVRDVDAVMALGLAGILWLYPLAWYHYDVIFIPAMPYLLVTAHRQEVRFVLWLFVCYLVLRLPPAAAEAFHQRKWMQFAGRTALVA